MTGPLTVDGATMVTVHASTVLTQLSLLGRKSEQNQWASPGSLHAGWRAGPASVGAGWRCAAAAKPADRA